MRKLGDYQIWLRKSVGEFRVNRFSLDFLVILPAGFFSIKKLCYMNMLSRIMNLLNNDSNNLTRILIYYYNKIVIHLRYSYQNEKKKKKKKKINPIYICMLKNNVIVFRLAFKLISDNSMTATTLIVNAVSHCCKDCLLYDLMTGCSILKV
ncbi:hypothetical protein BZL39_M05340 [Zygosaccharomyces parabailii]|nr:hypothetical protein BZL39_L05340 [Zygosaccharomyces parabailii]AQZ17973.1 hypothetical protein BZL39_M05340 [Zygosaccharomyces parabailii]